MSHYIWQTPTWPEFRQDAGKLLAPLGECRSAAVSRATAFR
jgi:hypothetical protein